MTVTELQQEFLASNEEHIAPEDFFILLAHATRKEKVFLLAHPEYNLDTASEALAREFFKRRQKHEPIALITGHKEFYGHDFMVTEDTLIPRPETELLVEHVLNEISNFQFLISKKITIVDVGTGSGNIIISIASELLKFHSQFSTLNSQFILYATDISKKALAIARENAKAHNVSQTITFLHGDLLTPYIEKHLQPDTSLIITANLPYLSHALYKEAPQDVQNFEPISALVSERAGLDHYYRLLESIQSLRAKEQPIALFLEISPEQAPSLKSFITSLFSNVEVQIHKDLAGKERIVEIHI